VDIQKKIDCVLLAVPHHGLSEGIRGFLETVFEAVVMVADAASLFESAKRLTPTLAIVDLSLTHEDGIGLVRRLHGNSPMLRLIVIGSHDAVSVSQAVLGAGANGYVLRRTIGTDLLSAVDAVLIGRQYVSPTILRN
jgi:DNA-binding NarL/FixJ family response regulator